MYFSVNQPGDLWGHKRILVKKKTKAKLEYWANTVNLGGKFES